MRLPLDSGSPIPLYHQISEGIRHLLATGAVSPGQTLPSLREAARAWGVNLHTVRRAYTVLAEEGLVEALGARGTVVLGAAGTRLGGRTELAAFLEQVRDEARIRHGLEPADLARHLVEGPPLGPGSLPVVHVVECSESECEDHVRELRSAWEVDARPWSLAREGEPPEGPVLATYFHYNEIRRRWPLRFPRIHFVAIRPDPQLVRLIPPAGESPGRRRLVLFELDELKAQNVAADLAPLFPPDRFHIEPRVIEAAQGPPDLGRAGPPLLFSPRAWDALPGEARSHPRVFKVFYTLPSEELEALGRRFGWRPRPPGAGGLRSPSVGVDLPGSRSGGGA